MVKLTKILAHFPCKVSVTSPPSKRLVRLLFSLLSLERNCRILILIVLDNVAGIESRLCILPHERHSYRAKESILHMAWEQEEWLRSMDP